MEIFCGSFQDPDFEKWLRELTKNQGRITIIVQDEISCWEARAVFKTSSENADRWALSGFEKALVHFISCQDRGCKAILTGLMAKGS